MAHAAASSRAFTWEEICNDPSLRDLPYKIETNEWGQIVMSPTRLRHGAFQFAIGHQLQRFTAGEGRVVTECAVRTSKGTKVADTAWFSSERWAEVEDEYDSPKAPEICVEVLSPRNSPEEIEAKRFLYFEHGASEVWLCDGNGTMTFYTSPRRTSEGSQLLPDFPRQIDV